MTAIDFTSHTELAAYVDDNAIIAANIVNITVKDGRWYLFHY